MPRMEVQTIGPQTFYLYEVDDGTLVYPGDLFTLDQVRKLHPGAEIETVSGFGVRLSMPGYLDSTEWEYHETREDAEEAAKMYECECCENNCWNGGYV